MENEFYWEQKCFVGIDPGLSGAIGIINEEGKFIAVHDMPTMVKTTKKIKVKKKDKGGNVAIVNKTKNVYRVNGSALSELLKPYASNCRVALVEHVASRPLQSSVVGFSLGETFGVIQGVLATLGFPVQFVTPQMWKKYFKLNQDKELSRTRCIQLYPVAPLHRKMDEGRAEALLIARYGFEQNS